MSGSWGEIWWYGGDWYDRRQDLRHQEELADLRYRQSRESERLRSQLQQVHGSLEKRVSRLAAAFDAFVEISDIREDLRAFQPAETARHRTRRLLAAVTRVYDAPPGGDLQAAGGLGINADGNTDGDVPGYWLVPAGAALAAIVRDDDAAAEAALADAKDRDSRRTATFLSATLALAHRPDHAARHLGPLLDLRADEPVTRAQQALWHAAAEGLFGESGRRLIEDRLAAGVATAAEAPAEAEAAAWRTLVHGLAGGPQPRPTQGLTDVLGRPAEAAERLEALHAWCAERLGPNGTHGAHRAHEADQPATTAATSAAASAAAPLATVVDELIAEGAPDERPLLQRIVELRRIVEAENGNPAPPASQWDGPAGDLLPSLRAEATSAPTPGRRAVATRAAVPFLRPIADELAAEAAQALPEELDVNVGRHRVRFSGRHPDRATVDAARAAVGGAGSGSGLRGVAPFGLGGLAAILLIAGALAGAVALVVLGVVAGVAGVWSYLEAQRTARGADDFRRAELNRLDQEIARIGETIGRLRTEAGAATGKAAASRAALDDLFRVARPSGG